MRGGDVFSVRPDEIPEAGFQGIKSDDFVDADTGCSYYGSEQSVTVDTGSGATTETVFRVQFDDLQAHNQHYQNLSSFLNQLYLGNRCWSYDWKICVSFIV